jgi:tRNA(fMet)-specific endonuclease VapC
MKYLLDTNVCIAAMRGNPKVTARLGRCAPEDCAVSMVSVYELFAGVYRCSDPGREASRVSEFLKPIHLLPFCWESALRAAEIRFGLEKSGLKIGPYDVQLAGQAMALELICVTHNTREFGRVENLMIEDWES